MRILIVEDDGLISSWVQGVLTAAGRTVVGISETAEGALEIAGRAAPDLALVDVNLAGEDDGVDLARTLLVSFGVPTIFLSGDENKARRGADVGLAYLPKPFTEPELLVAVEVAEGIIENERKAAAEPRLELF